MIDPLPLAQALLRCPSVTLGDREIACDRDNEFARIGQGALAEELARLGFEIQVLWFGTVANLFAWRGSGSPHFCFAGHTDVVPPGEGWSQDPFGGAVVDGVLYGRGACDMKGAIAAFVAAVEDFGPDHPGTISLMITGDEEGVALNGTRRLLEWAAEEGFTPDFCLVGEPTNPSRLGEVIKIGRRGSVNMVLTVHGVQGHVAYPQRADNPIHRLTRVLARLIAEPLDEGTDWFEPSSLQLTSVDVGNAATNVIPASAVARLNVRFNDLHDGESLVEHVERALVAEAPGQYDLAFSISGEAFLTPPGPLVEKLAAAVARVSGVTPTLDTGGGTSDARFITAYCPVAEFGLVGATMHKTDECVPVADLRALAEIYRAVLAAYLQ